jgi:hypothetical protein
VLRHRDRQPSPPLLSVLRQREVLRAQYPHPPTSSIDNACYAPASGIPRDLWIAPNPRLSLEERASSEARGGCPTIGQSYRL